ncbi:MAG: cytochrome c biogenesis heme-transporting ATPase CcmA [Acidiferrobacterales bacterium]
MLETINLECTRGDRPLVSDLSFELARGELLHVVGSNGSGKTTLLRTLCGLSRPSTGEIRFNGASIAALSDEYHKYLAYVGHSDGLQGELTAEENLRAIAGLSGSEGRANTVHGALERVGLLGSADLPAKILSQGQKRRLALARLPLLARTLWILDEPFSALDMPSVHTFEGLLVEHLEADGMVVIASHQKHTWRAKAVHRISLDT